jgi:hypothetical protein
MPSSQPSDSGVAALVTLCLLIGAVGVVAPVADAQSSSVSVTNATHTPQTPTAGETFEVQLTIENHDRGDSNYQINEVYVGSLGSQETVADDLGTLPPGASTTVTLPVTIDEPGWHTLTVNVNGLSTNGVVVNVQHPVTVQVVEEQRPQVELAVGETVPGATAPVNVTVANGDRFDLQQVAVSVSSPTANFTLTRRVRARLAAGNASTFEFPASVAESGTYPVNVTVGYTRNGDRHRVSRTFQAAFDGPASPGEIRLTGVDAVVSGGTLELSATASNVGTSPVDGVVVSVDDAGTVESADYFVGSVDASDFSSFTMTTTAGRNVSSVPVGVRYVVDGVERSYTTTVPVEQSVVRRPDPGSDGGGPPVAAIAGGVVVLLAVGGGFWWRR